jgi:hypothetical protein
VAVEHDGGRSYRLPWCGGKQGQIEKDAAASSRLVTPEMLRNLPEPVQRYMAFTGVVGKPWINTVRLKQRFKIRLGPDKRWMPMSAVQDYTTDPPGFVWKARFKIAGLPLMTARDRYEGGHGYMLGKIAGLFTLFNERGEKFDQGALSRYLSEMVWFPAAFLGENVAWQAIDNHSAQATITDCGRSISGRLFFDDAGRPTNFTTTRYYYKSRDDIQLQPWSTPMTGYAVRAGLNIPVRAKAVWNLPSGDYPYWDGEITEVEYNHPS